MKTRLRFLWLILVFLLPAFVLPAVAQMRQPFMARALERLEAAKTSPDPIDLLVAARKALKNASHNKEGQRLDAIGFVDEAIAYARRGERGNMLDRIDKAIGNTKSGMARSGPR